MKIICIDKDIKQVLETGYYNIPRFQRPYSWEKEHINEFWNDTVMGSEIDYFIGSFVVYKTNQGLYGIVDGQQRLTTLTMILCSIRDCYIGEGLEDLARGVHNLVERVDLSNKKQFILQTETSYPYLQEYIQKFDDPDIDVQLGSEEENLKAGFELINYYLHAIVKQIKSNRQIAKENLSAEIQKKLTEVRDKILKLKVIYIELDDEDDAYTIFETLNTRGKDLSVTDLAKNYLTKLVKSTNDKADMTKEKWNKIRGVIESSSAELDTDTFLLHVWLSKYGYTSMNALFKKLKAEVRGSENAKMFLDELVVDSSTYKDIFDPESKSWNKNEFELKRSLSALNSFRVTQQTPMVLAIMREYYLDHLKYKHAMEGIMAVEHFHYIFTAITSQRSSGGISSMYSTHSRKLSLGADVDERIKAIRELKEKMREKLPTLEEFIVNFKTLRFTNDYTKNKKIIHYTLSKMDEAANNKGAAIHYDRMTIEHILPQNPAKKSKEHDDVVGMIGNLILVDEDLNGKLDNKEFLDKKAILAQTLVFVDGLIQNADKWGPEEIVKRTETMARVVYTEIFKI